MPKNKGSKQQLRNLIICDSFVTANEYDNRLSFKKAAQSIEYWMDTNVNTGFKARIVSIKVTILAWASNFGWIKAYGIDTLGTINESDDINDYSVDTALATRVTESFGRQELCSTLFLKQQEETLFNANRTFNIPQRTIDLINSRIEESSPTEEYTICLLLGVPDGTYDITGKFFTDIRYVLNVNDIGVGR